MPSAERSFSEVLQDIVLNLQDIIRSEVRLAKNEVREDLAKARAAIALLVVGAGLAVFAVLFLLLCALYALSYFMPAWAAALTVAALLALGAIGAVVPGTKQFRQLKHLAPKTIESMKENIEWTKQQIK